MQVFLIGLQFATEVLSWARVPVFQIWIAVTSDQFTSRRAAGKSAQQGNHFPGNFTRGEELQLLAALAPLYLPM